jgi:NhaP-type Na+/H+ or K+/H+ antiporter
MILTRAGLELSPKQLKKLKGVVPLLAFVPCVVEASACALFTWLLFTFITEKGYPDEMSVAMCFVSGFESFSDDI